ncbi:YdcF family protein [Nocardia brasiliensis]|uniref:YdcF family protein n=1 Tax=Nocardia brasiliensis TaxID=37326 RepID=UPI003D8D473B
MNGRPQLSVDDFRQLASIINGPHGRALSAECPADILIVFSCADASVGHMAASLFRNGLVKHVIFSGGVGKDSGGLVRLGIAEAQFLASIAIADGLPPDVITLELQASNGRENASFSLQLAAEEGLLTGGCRIVSLAPAVRCRRLYEELRYLAGHYPDVAGVSGLSSGTVDIANEAVQAELVRELRGLATMHALVEPRIHKLDEFHSGGIYFDIARRAGIGM